ncbi:MAG: hypothetical protein NZO16_03635, partial [Deltaproteobacteria bacterium]|nr:hypothetical protein [Deltaproteobacteria bacterium]
AESVKVPQVRIENFDESSNVANAEQALQLVLTKHYSELNNFLKKIVGTEFVMDAIQNTCLKVLSKFSQLRDRSCLKSWIFSIAKNEAFQILRKQRFFEVRKFKSYEKDDYLVLDLDKKWASLKSHDELCLFALGYSLREIARFKKISVGSVKSRIFRSRVVLRSLFN